MTARLAAAGSNQQTQYHIRLKNDSSTSQTNLSLRVFLNLSEVYAAGLRASDVTADLYWSQCGAVQLGPLRVWNAAQHLYYLPVAWKAFSFAPHQTCEVQFGLHLRGR
ncbi:MAG: cellulose binding domain-containing protein [Dehalococcoidia bacterium]